MALSAVIFDLDGTLVDANMLHARAFAHAFEEMGYRVGVDRLAREIGRGGTWIVPEVLGREAELRHGDAIREGHDARYHQLIEEEGVSLFPGVPKLLEALQERGLKTAIATGAKRAAVEKVMRHCEVDLTEQVDFLVTDTDVERSKPHPDTVLAAIRKLEVSPAECTMVGDAIWDAQAARRAGVTMIGMLTGDYSVDELQAAGARTVYADAGGMAAHLDEALAAASPGADRLTTERLEGLMQEALDEARQGLQEDELPIGSVVARPDGSVLARGRNRARQKQDRLAHAEMEALHALEEHPARAERDLVLVSTLEPCLMCLGAILEAGIDTVVYALDAPSSGGVERCQAPTGPGYRYPRTISGLRMDDSRALLSEYLEQHPDTPRLRQLLSEEQTSAVES